MKQSPRQTKYIIKQCKLPQAVQHKNIFWNSASTITPLDSQTPYSIVGDEEFKNKYYHSKHKSLNKTCETNRTIEETTFCHYLRSIQNRTLTSKLSQTKQAESTQDERTMNQFKFYKNRERRIEQHLKNRMHEKKKCSLSHTITFSSVQQIYVHPNPEKIELINDNIPQFWQQSLRDNEKRLKRHIKGNTYKKQVAQEMLQTLKGKSLLQHSIPKIKLSHQQPTCSREAPYLNRKRGLTLHGNRLADHRHTTTEFNSNNKLGAYCEQVYKISYDAANKWRATELI